MLKLPFTYLHHGVVLKIVTKSTSKGEIPKNHDNQNVVAETGINVENQEIIFAFMIYIMERLQVEV